MFCVDCGKEIPDGETCDNCNPKAEATISEPKMPSDTATMADEITIALHRNKAFVWQGLIALILYYVGFYIVGLIANLVFLSQAKKTSIIINENPPGFTFLKVIFWLHFTLPVILGIIFVIGYLNSN
ncbi:hypothetical protein P4E94_14260 [Pontiellaceae bacterium B12219]|nr:hypothetical protein [Pontiellaceae bacterium B12219]